MGQEPLTAVNSALPVVDNRASDTLFVDGIQGLSVIENTVIFNLTRTTIAAPGSGEPQAYVDTVLRLAIPYSAFARIAVFLKQNLDAMEHSGIFPAEAPKTDAGQ